MPACALALTLLAAAPQAPIDQAAVAASRGELSKALDVLTPLLVRDPSDPKALFVRACVELESGRLDEAAADAKRVADLAPKSAEGAVLPVLVELRRAHPAESWTATFIQALREAPLKCPRSGWMAYARRLIGDPVQDPADARFFPEELETHAPLDSQALASGGFLLRATESKDKAALLREAIAVAEAPAPFTTCLVALDIIERERTPAAVAAARALLTRLVAQRPRNLGLQFDLAVRGTDPTAPFTSDEIARLEQIEASSEIEPSLRLLYEVFKAAYDKVDPAGAPEAAFAPAVLGYPFLATLLKRARATKDPALSPRVAALLMRLSRKLDGQPFLVDFMVSVSLARAAVEIHATEVSKDRLDKLEPLRELARRKSTLFSFMGEFPIASLQRDLVEQLSTRELQVLDQFPEVEAACPGSPGPKKW